MGILNTSLFAILMIALQAGGYQNSEKQHTPASSSSFIGQPKYKKHVNQDTITIEAFKIVDGDSDEIFLRMDKDGKCYLGKSFIGTITRAGEIKDDNAELVIRLKGEQFMTTENKVLLLIKADGTISDGSGKDMTWDEDGFLTNSETGLKLVPADTKAKKAASMLLTAFMGFGVSE